ncbi:hypothetical protein [Streptomyces sp. NPDC127039]|uniref:hypothetical protein n=1 Tax=Streptomyces sp. NPDC127039 TaxID=3347115 RepID=UPI00364D9B3C
MRADPAKLPKNGAQARDLIAAVLVGPETFGPDVTPDTPYERPSKDWPVLGEDCVWQRENVPDDVLATRTRYFELPASGGKGPVQLTATVTVHRTAEGADWENAAMLEESMRCPEQRLRDGERLTDLFSTASHFGEGQNFFAEDSLSETGQYVSDTLGGPYPYWWAQARVGSVLVSVAVKTAKGREEQDVSEFLGRPQVTMVQRVVNRVGTAGSSKGGT